MTLEQFLIFIAVTAITNFLSGLYIYYKLYTKVQESEENKTEIYACRNGDLSAIARRLKAVAHTRPTLKDFWENVKLHVSEIIRMKKRRQKQKVERRHLTDWHFNSSEFRK